MASRQERLRRIIRLFRERRARFPSRLPPGARRIGHGWIQYTPTDKGTTDTVIIREDGTPWIPGGSGVDAPPPPIPTKKASPPPPKLIEIIRGEKPPVPKPEMTLQEFERYQKLQKTYALGVTLKAQRLISKAKRQKGRIQTAREERIGLYDKAIAELEAEMLKIDPSARYIFGEEETIYSGQETLALLESERQRLITEKAMPLEVQVGEDIVTGLQAEQMISEQITGLKTTKTAGTKQFVRKTKDFDLPKGTKVVTTDEGFEYKIPESAQLEFAEVQKKESEKLPPGIREVVQFGVGLQNITLGLGKAWFGLFGAEKEYTISASILSATAFHPVGSEQWKQLASKQLKATRFGVHYPTALDIAFEPIGLAPKGTTEFLKASPWIAAGGVAGELAVGYALAQGMKPVGAGLKTVGGKAITHPSVVKAYTKIGTGLSKFTLHIPGFKVARYSVKQFVKRSPKRFGLQITKRVPYVITETPRATGMIGMVGEKIGQKLGLVQFTKYGTKVTYRRLFPGLPKVTETGKIFFGGRKLSYGQLGKGFYDKTVRTAIFGLDDTGKLTIMYGKTGIGKPFGLFGRKVTGFRGVAGLKYQQILMPDVTDITKASKMWGLAKKGIDIDSLAKKYWDDITKFYAGKDVGKAGLPKFSPYDPKQIVSTMKPINIRFKTGTGLTAGEKYLIQMGDVVPSVYPSFLPGDIVERMPQILYLPKPKTFSKLFGKFRIPGMAMGVGLITPPGGRQASEGRMIFEPEGYGELKIDPVKRIKFKPSFKPFRPSITTPIMRTDIMQGMEQITVPMQDIGQTQQQDFKFVQQQMQELDLKTVQTQVKVPLQQTQYRGMLPYIPLPSIYGRGRAMYDLEAWEKEFRERQFKGFTLKQALGFGNNKKELKKLWGF